MTVTAKGLDGSSGSIRSGEGVEEEDTSAGFVKYCPIVLKNAKKRRFCALFQRSICGTEQICSQLKLFKNI